eukprot:m.230408 g.230408  ORF g.230408 m.230408 type:complete len:487 (+) comp19259_c0_seq4:384-1844(+)
MDCNRYEKLTWDLFAPRGYARLVEFLRYYNGTGSPAESHSGIRWVMPRLATLISINGTTAAPVANVTLHGIGFRDTTHTYMDAWGVPSGGDWALHRGGAVFLENTEKVQIESCGFRDLGGNAVFLSGYTRNVTVSNSTFAFIGENAMAAWGFTDDLNNRTDEPTLPRGVEINGSSGLQPRYTTIVNNIVSDIGLNERQSSAWGEFKACLSLFEGNIVYNIPRAAVNINDGFGGGTKISKNLLFNTCRESGDHGPFNSWDRQPYLTDVAEPTTEEAQPHTTSNVSPRPLSLVPAYNDISGNFIFSNYGAGFGVDNDDTSSYYKISGNLFIGGGGVKCDYAGHDKYFFDNVLIDQQGGAACHHTCAYKKPYTDHCYNNTIVQATRTPGDLGQTSDVFAIIWFCNADNPARIMPDYDNSMLPVIHSNRIYNSNGTSANVTCGYSGPDSATTVSLSVFLEHGLFNGTTVHSLPEDSTVVAWGRAVLGMHP